MADLKYKVGDTVYVDGTVVEVDESDDDLSYLVKLNENEEWMRERNLQQGTPLTLQGIDDLIAALQRFKVERLAAEIWPDVPFSSRYIASPSGITLPESIAPENKPLIKAAPDLLEALKNLVNNLIRLDGGRTNTQILLACVEAAKQVIARTEGS